MGDNGKRGCGTKRSYGIQVAVYFDEDTLKEVREHAVKQQLSLSKAIIELTEWGLLDAKN
jgi:hypothetical protein